MNKGFLLSLLQRSFASRALDVAKMKAFAPCDIDDHINKYKARMVNVVFDPLRVPKVNAIFRSAGYDVGDDDGNMVIAVNDDASILIWGGLNSVFHLRKGEKIGGAFDEAHLAFNDILDLTARFKIKNKKVEIDKLIADLKAKYGQT